MFRLKHILFALVLLVGMLSCTIRPKNVLSKSEMVDVLYDLHKTDGVVHVQAVSYVQDEELKKYYESTLLKHGITQAQFDSSIVWYTDNPKRFSKIYPIVIRRLQAELDKYAWLDELKDATSIDEDRCLMELDSLNDIFINGLPVRILPNPKDLIPDSMLVYVYLIDSIDSLSFVYFSAYDSITIANQEPETTYETPNPKEITIEPQHKNNETIHNKFHHSVR